eukprot:scaffold13307_cov97-Isochrysis_galbana.AAC.3
MTLRSRSQGCRTSHATRLVMVARPLISWFAGLCGPSGSIVLQQGSLVVYKILFSLSIVLRLLILVAVVASEVDCIPLFVHHLNLTAKLELPAELGPGLVNGAPALLLQKLAPVRGIVSSLVGGLCPKIGPGRPGVVGGLCPKIGPGRPGAVGGRGHNLGRGAGAAAVASRRLRQAAPQAGTANVCDPPISSPNRIPTPPLPLRSRGASAHHTSSPMPPTPSCRSSAPPVLGFRLRNLTFAPTALTCFG